MPDQPQTIGRYEVIRRLGAGGMGEVYLARDPEIGRQVALKILRTDSEEYRRRFRIEVTAAGSLRHRHIVTIFDSGLHDGAPFLAMEYIPGETLADKIARHDPIALADKLRYAQELCEGLAHAHKAGIVHRDIKPANLVVDSEGNHVKILDFGIARVVEHNATQSGFLIGTLNYMSPEQITGRTIDQRSDVFSAGLVLYELLSSQKAFPGRYEDGVPDRILHAEPERLESLVPGIDPRIVSIVERALKKDPNERYRDAASMATELRLARSRLAPQETSAGEATILATPAPAPAPRRARSVRVAVVAAIGATAIALSVWAAIAFRARDAAERVSPPTPVSTMPPARPATPESAGANANPDSRVTTTVAPATPAVATGADPVADPRDAERTKTVVALQQMYVAGDGERTLNAIEAAGRDYPRDPELARLVRRLYGDAERRADLAEARANGALGSKVAESMAFRRASDRKSEAKTSMAKDLPGAIRALWAAADLFDLAATERPAAAGETPGRSSEPPAPANPPVETPKKPAETTVPSNPAPAPSEPARRAEMPAAPPTADEERAAIERTLNEYRSAYEALDIRRVLRVYPTLASADALARAFEDAREVRIGFSRPTITLTAANTAVAKFNRTQEFVPKVGKPMAADKRALTVQLRKDSMGMWVIEDVR